MYDANELKKTADRDPQDLSYAAVNFTSEHVDWRGLGLEGFHYWEATYAEDENPGDVIVYPDDQNEIGVGPLYEICPGPMMNYAYELPDSPPYGEGRSWNPSRVAATLYDLPLCVVEFENQQGLFLALTGGGMDLSWEICEAYVRLGFYPPTQYADVPQMAGKGTSEEDHIVIEACEEAFLAQSERANRSAERVRETREKLVAA